MQECRAPRGPRFAAIKPWAAVPPDPIDLAWPLRDGASPGAGARRSFSWSVACSLLSLIPLLGFAIAMTSGTRFFLPEGSEPSVNLDSQFRYLAGVYTAVTIAIWWTLPKLEERIAPLRIACAGVFVGGVGRLVSMAALGAPSDPTLVAGVALEMGVVPLLLLWHARLARRA
jgi:hypothetical protein